MITQFDYCNDGGPAFPISLPGHGDNGGGGMTLRDYFAAQFMSTAAGHAKEMTSAQIDELIPGCRSISRAEIAAALAYRMADAMLSARRRAA